MLFNFNLIRTKDEIRAFLGETSGFIKAASGIAGFNAVDHEGGAVHRFGGKLTRLPAPASFLELTGKEGKEVALRSVEANVRRSAGELRNLGINMNLAPAAEVLTPKNRAFLEIRSYGGTLILSKRPPALLSGHGSFGVVCVIKHFPGHGAEDPLVVVTVLDQERNASFSLA